MANELHHKSKHVTRKAAGLWNRKETPSEKQTRGTALMLELERRSEQDGGANGTGVAVTSPIPPKGVPLGLATPTRRGTTPPPPQ